MALTGLLSASRLLSLRLRKLSPPPPSVYRLINISTASVPARSTPTSKNMTFTVKEGIAVLTLDSPGKVNTLNEEVMEDIAKVTKVIDSDPDILAAVIMSKKSDCFIAGADIQMIDMCKTAEEATMLSREGQRILQDIHDSKKPIVAAIQGSCLGGGLEVALACHHRVAVNTSKTRFGLPEVMLGILPGLGGTQRLPKLVGLNTALGMLLKGKSIPADRALKVGLVNHLVDPLGPGIKSAEQITTEYLEATARRIAHDLATGSLKKSKQKPLSDSLVDIALSVDYVKDKFFSMAKDKVINQTKGLYPAPFKILDVVRKGMDKGHFAGLDEEALAFGELALSPESKGLVSLFHGQTECKKSRFGEPQRPVMNMAILGAGLMGSGIVQVSADKGYNVILKDSTERGLSRGFAQVNKGFEAAKSRKHISQWEMDLLMSNIKFQLDYKNFDKVDMVIEAVFEDLELKHKVLAEVEDSVPEHCIFASNTSAIPISSLAAHSKRPEKVVGMHYFSPVEKMQLVEVVWTRQTSKDTIASAIQVALKQGKVVITVRDGPGFYTTRVLASMMAELIRLLQEGVDPKRLDKLTTAFGFPVGACTLGDEVGLDVASHIARDLAVALGPRATGGSVDMLEEMVNGGHLGRKSGRGIFMYDEGVKDRPVNPAAQLIVDKHKLEPRLPLTDEDVLMRMVTRFVNEAVLCLQEDILANAMEGDVGAVFGLGFPPFTGGPFHYIDRVGAQLLVDKMHKYRDAYGVAFTPCELLLDHARDSSKRFFPEQTQPAKVSVRSVA